MNHQIITRNEVREAMAPQLPEIYQRFKGAAREEALRALYEKYREKLIEEALIAADFSERGAFIPDLYVEAEIESIIRNQFKEDRNRFEEELIKSKKSYDVFFEQTRKQLGNRMLVNEMVGQRAHVSPDKIRQIYEENRADYLIPEKIKYSLITIYKGTNEEEKALKEREVQHLLEELASGRSFNELARQFSRANRAEDGGAYPWLQLKDLPSAFTEVVASLEAGEYSPVIDEADRYVILHVDARRTASYQPFDEVRDAIEKEQLIQARERHYTSWIDRLKDKHYVIRYD